MHSLRGRWRGIIGATGLLVAFALAVGPALATQYSPPWADVFSFTYSDINTTRAGDWAVAELATGGYHSFDDVNKSAATSMGSSYAKSDAVWAAIGHGLTGGGGFMFYNGTSSSWLYATSHWSGGQAYLSSQTYTEFHDIRHMAFLGCDTAKEGHPGGSYGGSLLRVAYSKLGVDSTLGFKGTIYFPGFDWWPKAFFTRTRMGDTVSQAAAMAVDMVIYSVGWDAGSSSWYAYGGGVKLKPAAYGS
jgi:hypothetical protein